MSRVLSTVLAVTLLLGLATLAVLAMPNGHAALPPVSAAAPEFEPDAPAAAQNYNTIGMPLNAAAQFTAAGYQFNADGLASLIGPGVVQVLKWDKASQAFVFRLPGVFGQNFALAVGEAYWVLLDGTATANVVSFVGDVPAEGSVVHAIVGDATCKYTNITIPLDQSGITTADQLAASINTQAGASVVTQVLAWDPVGQSFTYRLPGVFGPNFAVSIGYPYFVCSTQAVSWP